MQDKVKFIVTDHGYYMYPKIVTSLIQLWILLSMYSQLFYKYLIPLSNFKLDFILNIIL